MLGPKCVHYSEVSLYSPMSAAVTSWLATYLKQCHPQVTVYHPQVTVCHPLCMKIMNVDSPYKFITYHMCIQILGFVVVVLDHQSAVITLIMSKD